MYAITAKNVYSCGEDKINHIHRNNHKHLVKSFTAMSSLKNIHNLQINDERAENKNKTFNVLRCGEFKIILMASGS